MNDALGRILRSAHRARHCARVLTGSCLLLLYLAAATPLAAALIALLASADSDHHATIRLTARGLQVVLHHDCSNAPTHRHGMVARVLTLFAQRATPAQMDHVIQFNTTDTVRESPPLAVEPETCSAAAGAFHESQAAPRTISRHHYLVAFPRPPPVGSGVLLLLRSTVLLV